MITVLYISHESKNVLGSTSSLVNMIYSTKGLVNPIVIVPSKGTAFDYIKSKGIKVYAINFPLNITTKKGLSRILFFIPRVLRDFLEYIYATIVLLFTVRQHIDLIHSNSSVISFGYNLSKILRKKHIWHIREFYTLGLGFSSLFGWNCLLKTIKNSDYTICITKSVQKHFKLDDSIRCKQIYDAVVKQTLQPINFDKQKYFILCGNLSKTKGCDLAIDAFSKFSNLHPGYKLKFIGPISPDYKAQLEERAKIKSISESIEFEGYKGDMPYFYSNATALLMCSPYEGMGRVTVEAMYYGCPVIGLASSGTQEIISNEEDGFLFTHIEECACLMDKCTNIDNVRTLVKKAQLKSINNFSEENYKSQILSVYNLLLSENSPKV